MRIKTFNVSPVSIAELVTDKQYFISALIRYSVDRFLYSVDKYFLTDLW